MCSISDRTRSRSVALLHYPLDRSNEPLGPAPKLVVKTKPPEQDLDFTGAFHYAAYSTKHERDDKPLGIGGLVVRVPIPQEPCIRLSVESSLPADAP
jgi:hypothetical protein